MSKNVDVALLTCSLFPNLQKDYWPLQEQLATSYGLKVKPLIWNDPEVDWKVVKNIVICSAWDYCDKLFEFTEFLKQTTANIINPIEVIEWNINKTYLKTFSDAGIPTIPTVWLDKEDNLDAIEQFDSKEIVIKPAVGAGSSGMRKFTLNSPEAISSAKEHAKKLLQESISMVQPYLDSADLHGENALVLFDGKLSHSIHRPVAGHKGTPDQEIETASYIEASSRQKEIAEKIVSCLPFTPAYLRVDFLKDNKGADVVLEAEMIEPTLFFEVYPKSIKTYTDALCNNHIVI